MEFGDIAVIWKKKKKEKRNKDGVTTSDRGEGEEKFRLSQGKDKERNCYFGMAGLKR